MNSNFLLAAKAKVFTWLLLAAGSDPFAGAGNLANNWAGKSVVLGLSMLILGAIITFIVFGMAGEQTRNKMKAKLGYIVLAVIGLSAAAGAIPWIHDTTHGWFGG